jgi:hypothetical protein
MGINMGITMHQNRGFAISNAAAASIATTAQSKIAIRIAAVRVDTICMAFPPGKTQIL